MMRPSEPWMVALLETGMVLAVAPDSDEIPPAYKARIATERRMTGFHAGACAVRRDDGIVVLVSFAEDEVAHRHEFIHAAQEWADGDAMREAFEATADDGRRIARAVAGVLGHEPGWRDAHRDVGWAAAAWRTSRLTRHIEGDNLEVLDYAMDMHPVAETAAVAKDLGIADGPAVVAAIHACFLREQGFADWGSVLAKELVAYRYEAAPAHPVVARLAASALAAIAELSAPSIVP